MANKDPSRTEKPTSKRIQDARADGNVCMSQDMTAVATMIGGVLFLFWTGPAFYNAFNEVFEKVVRVDCTKSWGPNDLQLTIMQASALFARVMLPFMFGVIFFGAIAIRLQIGSYFSTKALKWKFNQLNPATGFKKILPNKDNIFKSGLAFLKVMVIGFIVYQSFADKFQEAMELPLTSLEYGLWWFFKLVMEIVVKVLVIFFVLAIIDFIWKKHQYQENLMMTKQEVKDENKMKEGDPKVKAKIRGKMRELITNSIVSNVQQSDVIVTNPVHVAVALKYSTDDAAPTIMAKGLRKRALYIKKLGRDAKIPVVESPALARSLYRHTKVGGCIPEHFFAAVASILAELQRTGKRNFMRKSDHQAA